LATVSPLSFLRRVLAIAGKELLHVTRDPRLLYAVAGIPVVVLVIFGYGVVFDVERLPLAVLDADQTPSSRRLVDAVRTAGIFEELLRAEDAPAMERLLRKGAVRAGLIIEPGFHRDLKRGAVPRAQLLVDGADSHTAQVILGNVAALQRSLNHDGWARFRGGARAPIEARIQVRFNPTMKSPVFVVPGLLAVVLAALAVTLTALSVAGEWERGNVEQLFATPAARLEVILGKLLSYLVLGGLQLLLLLSLGLWLFEVPARGSVWLLGLSVLLFLCGMLAQGLFIGVVTRRHQIATELGSVTTVMPTLLLSGFLFPIDNMPEVLQALSAVVPARYFVDALRAILLRGGGLAEVWLDLLALGGFALLMITLATTRFRRRIG
jgi:ABC-2 type transport system permease protein